jgi:hypothetical protein
VYGNNCPQAVAIIAKLTHHYNEERVRDNEERVRGA